MLHKCYKYKYPRIQILSPRLLLLTTLLCTSTFNCSALCSKTLRTTEIYRSRSHYLKSRSRTLPTMAQFTTTTSTSERDRSSLISSIYTSSVKNILSLSITGGGTQAIPWLLSVPGARYLKYFNQVILLVTLFVISFHFILFQFDSYECSCTIFKPCFGITCGC